MKAALICAGFVLPAVLSDHTGTALAQEDGQGKPYGDPARFEKAVEAFESQDRRAPPPEGAVLCLGSSSIRMWHPTIKQDLAPLTVIPRGFGGSNMNDALHYVDRLVTPYKPRAIVLYEGDNDTAQGVAPEAIRDTFLAFVARVRKDLPKVRIYFLAIKPSIRRWGLWPKMKEANRLIAAECAKDDKLTYVDVAAAMLTAEGKLKDDIFLGDGLHLNRKGYLLWRDTLRPALLQKELPQEKATQPQPAPAP
jgi:lysophospholipase L1-like esterase